MKKHKLTSRSCALHLLLIFLKLKRPELNELINHLSEESVHKVTEVLFNIIYGDLPATRWQKTRLRKMLKENRVDFKYVTNTNNTVKKRRARLKKMTGGSLQFLLSTAVPILSKLINSAKS